MSKHTSRKIVGCALACGALWGCSGGETSATTGTPPADPEWVTMALPKNAAGDITIPDEVRDYMHRRAWGYAHQRWHQERTWDMETASLKAQLLAEGYQPFDKVPEGAKGSGEAFLAMHRHMFLELRDRFSRYNELWVGWEKIPREKDSPLVPVKARSDLSSNAIAALDRLEDDTTLAEFASADELGRYIWTTRLVDDGGVVTTSSDPTTGIHDLTLHQRWANAKSDVNLSEFSVTHENYIFWKMHGWIDDRWTKWRKLKGLPDTDAATDELIADQGAEMMMDEADRSDEVKAELGADHSH